MVSMAFDSFFLPGPHGRRPVPLCGHQELRTLCGCMLKLRPGKPRMHWQQPWHKQHRNSLEEMPTDGSLWMPALRNNLKGKWPPWACIKCVWPWPASRRELIGIPLFMIPDCKHRTRLGAVRLQYVTPKDTVFSNLSSEITLTYINLFCPANRSVTCTRARKP